jgi:hypothetical protein
MATTTASPERYERRGMSRARAIGSRNHHGPNGSEMRILIVGSAVHHGPEVFRA